MPQNQIENPVLSHEEEKDFFDICDKAQKAFGYNSRPYLTEWCKTHMKEISPHLKSVPDQKRTMPYEPNVMMFVYESIRQGAHPHISDILALKQQLFLIKLLMPRVLFSVVFT